MSDREDQHRDSVVRDIMEERFGRVELTYLDLSNELNAYQETILTSGGRIDPFMVKFAELLQTVAEQSETEPYEVICQ